MSETLHIERWLPVTGYEGSYEVSDLGRVRGLDRIDARGRQWKGRMMGRCIGSHGYLQVSLCNGSQKSLSVHRLVLEAFLGPCPDGMEACHGDGNRGNPRLSNLRWDTHKSNVADRDVHGTTARGARCGAAKLNATDIERIFDLRANGCKQQEIADWIGTSKSRVSAILRGKDWAHLGLAS